MKTFALTRSKTSITTFCSTDRRLWLTRLCDLPVGGPGRETGPAGICGPAVLRIDGRRYEADALVLTTMSHAGNTLRAEWKIGPTDLRLHTTWTGCPSTGIVRRQDHLVNSGSRALTVSRCLARITLPAARHEAYVQTSSWCRENQGAWQAVRTGLTLTHASGQTTQGNTPYLALRRIDSHDGLVAHVMPCGNWIMRLTPVSNFTGPTFTVLELGLDDTDLAIPLASGETLDLPAILFQTLPDGQPEQAAPALHRYLLNQRRKPYQPEAPVVYNTWFDQFERLDVKRLRRQAAAAKALGCDVLVIDAGWYGAGDGTWAEQVGDWREKSRDAFRGRMRRFADEIRNTGLGFGLWMEPERCMTGTPIAREHPEWLVPVDNRGTLRFDLSQPAAFDWMYAEMDRLVRTYGLAWMKIDSNLAFEVDASGQALHAYTAAWHRLLDTLRAAHPRTFFEGCSSGALRGDLAIMEHLDGHFLSDTVNPTDTLRILQGAWLRLPPGRITRWTVIRSAPRIIPRYGATVADSPPPVVVPGGGLWEPAEIADLHFALLAGMPGMFGLGGDIAGLPETDCDLIRKAIAFYKRYRRLLNNAVAHLLTPAADIEQRDGWMAVQLESPDSDTILVFVYRLGRTTGSAPVLRLQGLRDRTRYTVRRGFEDTADRPDATGCALMRDGLDITGIDTLHTPGGGATVFTIRPAATRKRER